MHSEHIQKQVRTGHTWDEDMLPSSTAAIGGLHRPYGIKVGVSLPINDKSTDEYHNL